MKKKLFIGISTLFAILAITIFISFKPKPASAAWCGWGYKSTTAWPGQCISCFCDTWNYTGRDACPKHELE